MTFRQIEEEELGADHARIGAEIIAQWQLPDLVILAAGAHHENIRVEGDQSAVDIVHVANAVAHMFGFGADVADMLRTLEAGALKRLEIGLSDVEKIVADSTEYIQGLHAQFAEMHGDDL
jgi:HD-like signal output (HDOD) protein